MKTPLTEAASLSPAAISNSPYKQRGTHFVPASEMEKLEVRCIEMTKALNLAIGLCNSLRAEESTHASVNSTMMSTGTWLTIGDVREACQKALNS